MIIGILFINGSMGLMESGQDREQAKARIMSITGEAIAEGKLDANAIYQFAAISVQTIEITKEVQQYAKIISNVGNVVEGVGRPVGENGAMDLRLIQPNRTEAVESVWTDANGSDSGEVGEGGVIILPVPGREQ